MRLEEARAEQFARDERAEQTRADELAEQQPQVRSSHYYRVVTIKAVLIF